MSTVIKVENLSKSYRLGVINRDMLLKDLQSRWAEFRGKEDPNSTVGLRHAKRLERGGEFWALRNIDLEVKEGESLGIIGRNGAGKSTLLKVLSQITAPTEGRIKVKGRIASLLEVGTGFHPELTGRENVYLNGAILGMTRKEVAFKFDEIVAFADIDEFIDTPVKRYSSGMYVRLAFAVAAHLDPEILIVDEVLAVGDANFQKKCLGKMKDVSGKNGRTVLFVSHSMNAVSELCSRAILIDEGTIRLDAPTRDVVNAYLSREESAAEIEFNAIPRENPAKFARLTKLKLMDGKGVSTTSFRMNEPLVAHIGVYCYKAMANVELGLKISSRSGAAIHYLTSTWEGFRADLDPGSHTFQVCLPHIMLLPGSYTIGLWILCEPDWSDDLLQDVMTITVLKADVTGYRTRFEQYASSGCEVYATSCWAKLGDSQ